MKSPLDRRTFLKSSGLALSAASLAVCTPAAGKPNILWIIGEDFSPELGCYGDPSVSTPNIDRLAAEGVLYTHACVTAPICSIARSAMMTGRYQTAIGAHNHRSHRNDDYHLPEGVGIFTNLFREAGYHTSNLVDTPVGGTGKTDFNFNLDEEPFDGTDWIQREESQPFYAQINFDHTHRPFHPHPKSIDADQVELPPYYPDDPAERKDWALYLEDTQHLDDEVGAVLQRLEEQGLAEDTIVIFFGDHGRAMPRGKQFPYEGGMVIPLIVRIPEKFRPAGWTPGSTDDQLISHMDITATSLALCGIDVPENYDGQVFIGPSASPARTVQFAARDRADETVDRIRASRTADWKYIRNFYPERPYTQPNNYKDTSYPSLQVMRQWKEQGRLTEAQAHFMADSRPEEELYDLRADRFELNNLAADPAHTDTLAEMRRQVDDWIDVTGDTGAISEDPPPREPRPRIDGWLISNGSLTRQDGPRLILRWTGRANVVRIPWVAEGGRFQFRFRLRSSDRTPEFFWATIDNTRGEGNRMPIEAGASAGEWRSVNLPFEVESGNWLTMLGLRFGEGDSEAEIEAASLLRDGAVVRSWEFA